MNLKVVLRVLSFVSLVITAFMIVPLAISLCGGAGGPGMPEAPWVWWCSIAAGIVISFALTLLGGAWSRLKVVKNEDDAVKSFAGALWGGGNSEIGMREGAAIVSFAWVIASVVGALPYVLSGILPNWADAFFETMSGFTTTGATVMKDIEASSDSVLFWRGLTHWIGGMGIIVLTLVALPLLGLNGMALYKSEVPGVTAEKLTPRLQRTAMCLWGLYTGLTALETVFLRMGGMSLFEAVIHSFSTIATGGFSTRNASVAAFNSPYIEWVLTVFMFVSGVNFAITFHVLRHVTQILGSAARRSKEWISAEPFGLDMSNGFWMRSRRHLRVFAMDRNELGDQELHGYTLIVLASAFLVAYCLYVTQWLERPLVNSFLDGTWLSGSEFELEIVSPFFHDAARCVRTALFHIVSLITTTGFVADDYAMWPQFTQFLMLFVMVIGACAGSTGGGCKVIRFQMLCQQIRMEMCRTLHPRAVVTARLNDKPIARTLIDSAAAFLMLYLAILVFATLAILALGIGDPRLEVTTSFSGVIACLSNVGPGLANLGPTANFSWLHWGSKIILSLCMLVGRLELFTVLLLFVPETWRR